MQNLQGPPQNSVLWEDAHPAVQQAQDAQAHCQQHDGDSKVGAMVIAKLHWAGSWQPKLPEDGSFRVAWATKVEKLNSSKGGWFVTDALKVKDFKGNQSNERKFEANEKEESNFIYIEEFGSLAGLLLRCM